MGKTSMQHLIEKIMRMPESNIKNFLATVGPEYLKQNKKEIVDAHFDGWGDSYLYFKNFHPEATQSEDYYNKKYGKV
jgi:hypothetical protein